MSRRVTCPFIITRTSSVPTAFDAAGHVADEESVDVEISGEVSGAYVEAEPDCGCAEGFEDLAFVPDAPQDMAECDLDLTDDEAERATAKLLDAMHDDFDD